jgi:hypothetical protein
MVGDVPGEWSWADFARASMGGPSGPEAGRNWMCLCGWLAPLFSPALCSWVSARRARTEWERRTVVEGEEGVAGAAGCVEEGVDLDEVAGEEGGRLGLEIWRVRLVHACSEGTKYLW